MPEHQSSAIKQETMAPYSVSPDALSRVRHSIQVLNDLLPQLHEANLAYHQAVEPAARLSEMDGHEKRQLFLHVRAANAQWNRITREIEEALDLCEPSNSQ